MNQPPDDRDATTATRSQNVVYTLAHDWGAIPQFLAPALERLDLSAGATQLLVITADAETALAVADAALALRDEPAARPALVPVTRPERVARMMRGGAPAAIAGTPEALAALVRGAALKLDGVRTLVVAWADDVAASSDAAALEAVLAEVPKDAARVLVAAEQTEAVEALIERYLRRPRRVASTAPTEAPRAVSLSYVPVTPAARPAALRRVLDELDPPSAAVVVSSDASDAEARRVLRGLGYLAPSGDGSPDDAAAAFGHDVRLTRGEVPPDVALAVLFDVPADRAALDRVLAGRPAQIVALAQPRQIGALRGLAGGAVTPLALPDLARRARSRDDALRAELRATLEAGVPHRELLALEPLLDTYDGVQLAAAALRLLEQARATVHAAAAPAAATPSTESGSGMTRLFLTVGGKDGVRPGDLVGAITGESGISSDRIGKIEVRDAFSLVEVASSDAARVLEKVNGIAIRGRRVNVRPEREQGARPERPERGDRKGPGGERRPPDRRGPGVERRPAGGGPRAFDARRDGPRGFGGSDDRGVSERAEQRDEWAARADRLRNARRARPESTDEGSPDVAPNALPGDARAMDSDEG